MWAQIRGFVRALFRPLPPEGVSYSLAKTLKESMHVRGGGSGGSVAASGRSNHLEIIEKGHDDYAASFEKRERPR